jgi:hypothetical protein
MTVFASSDPLPIPPRKGEGVSLLLPLSLIGG